MNITGKDACPACNKPLTGNEKFCLYCGVSITLSGIVDTSVLQQPIIPHASQVYNQQPVSEQIKKKKKGGFILKTVLIILFLVVAGITALWYLGKEPKGTAIDTGELTGTDIPGIVSIDDTMPDDAIQETTVDTGNPLQAAEAVEDAFARADTALLKQMLTPNSREIYKEAFKEIKPYMSEYSKAFSNRKLKMSSPIYALYEFTDEAGKKYTAEFALSDNGQWKLVRF